MSKEKKYLKEVLLSYEDILKHCKEMGAEITNDYKNCEKPPLFLGLLKGCHPFMSDLLKEIDLILEVDYMDVSSFYGGTQSTGEVSIIKDLTTTVADKDVIIVEDIVDSGNTIKKIKELLEFRGAKSVKVATLVDKPSGRKVDLRADYIGYEAPNAFLLGYGLDYNECFRDLNCVGIPTDEVIKMFDKETNE